MYKITVKDDGRVLEAKGGENLITFLRENGYYIPSLCFYEKVSPTGACRVCVVKDAKTGKLFTPCTTFIDHDMEIVVEKDEELKSSRKTVVELILSNHKTDCMVCEENGRCELQDVAYKMGIDLFKDVPTPIKTPDEYLPVDESSPILVYDPEKCIQCERCIKACWEIQGKGVISFINRGIDTVVAADLNQGWGASACDGCGECIQACPVAALSPKPLPKKAPWWELEKKETVCGYCGVGCKINYYVHDNEIVRAEGADGPGNEGALCVKGRFGYKFVNKPERLKKPLKKVNGEFVEIEWDEAIKEIAEKLKETKDKFGGDAIAGLASARATNEDNYVFQKFIRKVLKTNNVDHCARLCHASTVAGLAPTLGSGAMTNSNKEFLDTKCFFVIGSNTTETHPVIATYIKRAVLFHGAKLIVADPRKIELTKYADVWVSQKSGSDVMLINGLMHIIIKEGWADEEFIKNRVEGYEELKAHLESFTPEIVSKETGISIEELYKIADMYANSGASAIFYSMGITQHINGTGNVMSLADLAMITGNIGKPATGVNPLRGQNNVQGACDLGALPNVYPGYQKVVLPEIKEKFEKMWNTKGLSDKVGLSVVEIMNAILDDKVKALYVMGENPMVSDPNLNHVEEALKKVPLLIVQDIFLTETAQLADYVLPALSFLEKDGTFTSSERRIQMLQPVIENKTEAKPDWEIVQMIANAMGEDGFNFNSSADIMEEIRAVSPIYAGVSYSRDILHTEGLQWPVKDMEHPGTPYLHKGEFSRGKGKLIPVEYVPPVETPDEEYPFVLSTGRILFHYHTGTMTRKVDGLNGFVKDAYVEISADDAEELGVSDGEKIVVETRRGKITTNALISEKVRKGFIFAPFHFAEAAANRLTLDVLDPIAKIPSLKVAACKVKKA